MGYRSDVRIATSPKGHKVLKDYVKDRLDKLNKTNYNLMESCDVEVKGKYTHYFGWNSVKWYDGFDGYEEVDAIMDGLNYLEEQNLSYRYARIGESYDDYDEMSYDGEEDNDLEYPSMIREFDDMYVTRNIASFPLETDGDLVV